MPYDFQRHNGEGLARVVGIGEVKDPCGRSVDEALRELDRIAWKEHAACGQRKQTKDQKETKDFLHDGFMLLVLIKKV